MPSRLKKKCPICGEEIPEDAEICPHCGANLELFELEEEMDEEDITPLESFLDSIGDAEDVDPEKLLEEMRKLIHTPEENFGDGEALSEEKTQETGVEEEIKPNEEPPNEEEEVEYVCPVCGGVVGPEDRVCPHCGAIFVESDEEMEEVLEEQLEEAKRLIKTMREKKIDVSDVTPFLKNANLAKRKGDIESALENAIECVMRAREKLQTPSNSS